MMTEEQALRAIQRRREAERRNDEREEGIRLAEERRAKARRMNEEKPEVVWLMRVAWAIWILIGVESIKALASMI